MAPLGPVFVLACCVSQMSVVVQSTIPRDHCGICPLTPRLVEITWCKEERQNQALSRLRVARLRNAISFDVVRAIAD
jgi:hypothetical protein